MTKQPNLQSWLSSNAWNLIITLAGVIVAFCLMQYRVDANEIKIQKLDDKISAYPSKDYFDLKFKTIDEKFVELQSQVTDR